MIGPGRREVPRLEDEPDLVEEPAVKPLVNPGDLGDLAELAPGSQDRPDDAEQVELQIRGNDGTGRPEITASTWSIPRSRRIAARSRTSPSTTSKLGEVGEPLAEEPGEVGVAFEDDHPGSGRARAAIARVIGPVPAPSSTTTRAWSQSTS